MAARYKPTPRSICKVGTVAHNRSFTAHELREYVQVADRKQMLRWLKRHKLIAWAATGGPGPERYHPTAKGRRMIEKACRSAKAQR
jgi:hypothetical protein